MATPAILKHASNLYAQLTKDAKVELVVSGDAADTVQSELLIWRGHLSKVYLAIGVPTAYYSKVKNLLALPDPVTGFSCITQVVTGTRFIESVVALHRPPTADDYERFQARRTDDLTSAEILAILRGEVARLTEWHKSLGGLNIPQALRNIEQRLTKVEQYTQRADQSREARGLKSHNR